MPAQSLDQVLPPAIATPNPLGIGQRVRSSKCARASTQQRRHFSHEMVYGTPDANGHLRPLRPKEHDVEGGAGFLRQEFDQFSDLQPIRHQPGRQMRETEPLGGGIGERVKIVEVRPSYGADGMNSSVLIGKAPLARGVGAAIEKKIVSFDIVACFGRAAAGEI